MLCFKNAELVDQIDVLDRGFHYGDGCFSTARLQQGKLELYARHISRLALSNTRLCLNADLDLIDQTLAQLHKTESNLNGTVKIILSRGTGQRGYSLPNHPADVWLYYYPQVPKPIHYESIECGLLETQLGLSMPQLAGLKTLNRLEQVMLKQEADTRGWNEALVADVNGLIVEGVSSNCFIKINNQWITPELRYNGVTGVMRAEILARMQQYSIACETRAIHIEELSKIESLFFCNALSPMKLVTTCAKRPLDVDACIALFHHLQLNQMSSYVSE